MTMITTTLFGRSAFYMTMITTTHFGRSAFYMTLITTTNGRYVKNGVLFSRK